MASHFICTSRYSVQLSTVDSGPVGPYFDGLIIVTDSAYWITQNEFLEVCTEQTMVALSLAISNCPKNLKMTKNVQFRTLCWVKKSKQCFVLVHLNINTCLKSLLVFGLTYVYRCITSRAVTGKTCVCTKHVELHQTRAVTSQHVSLQNKDRLSSDSDQNAYRSVELFAEGGRND